MLKKIKNKKREEKKKWKRYFHEKQEVLVLDSNC